MDAGQSRLATLDAAIYPVADLALLYAIVAIVLRGLRDSSRAALSVAAAAMALVFIGDLVSGVEQLKGTYAQGGVSGLCFSLAWFGLAVAAYLQWKVKDGDRPIRGLADYSRSVPWLPYVAIAVAFTVPAIQDWNNLDALRLHVPATGLLIALVLARLSVTARQHASVAAAERERLAAAVDQAAEAILTTDRAGHVTYVNQAFTRITGYSALDIVGRDPDLLRQLADPASTLEMTQALTRGESWTGRLVRSARTAQPSTSTWRLPRCGMRPGSSPVRWRPPGTFRASGPSRLNSSRPRRWRRSGAWPAASPTTSTTS